VCLHEAIIVIAYEDGSGTVLGELMDSRTAYSKCGVCS
jgi:hypothetical protein